jgi:hypothetical protein
LIKTFPLYVYVDKGRILQIFEIGLNQFGVYLQKFQIKAEKKKKKKKKRVERPRGNASAQDRNRPTAQFFSLPNWYPLFFLFPRLIGGPHH